MRADAEERLARLHEHLGRATSVDEVVSASVRLLDDFLDPELGPSVLVHEMRMLGLRNGAIGAVQVELQERWRSAVVELFELKAEEGVIELSGIPRPRPPSSPLSGRGSPEAMADPEWDRTETVR